MPNKNSELVRKGYNKIAEKYNKQRKIYQSKPLLLKFLKYIPKNAKVLDLGCGTGISVAKFLDGKDCKVTGIDFSDGMLELARKNVPKAKFIKMDITKMKFKKNSFDGTVSFYAIIHIPRIYHENIYKKLHRMLKKNGIFLVNASGTCTWEETSKDYLGVPMYWSFYSPKITLNMIKNAGFEILWSKVLKLGNEKQFWVLAQNKK
ncbi:MAG TPA: class I SAM-dependent methyltransferase [Candidatus Nanoarchaeia archaeon]|nr:class I SAM-dependent methyltransferase [Candidatus Nanoarchaeia archaeon]